MPGRSIPTLFSSSPTARAQRPLLNLAPPYCLLKPRGEREFRPPIATELDTFGAVKTVSNASYGSPVKIASRRQVSCQRRHVALCYRSPLKIATTLSERSRRNSTQPLSVRSYISRNPASQYDMPHYAFSLFRTTHFMHPDSK